MVGFTIWLLGDSDFKYEWSCEGEGHGCVGNHGNHFNHRAGPIQAYKDAYAHAAKCLKRVRIEEGTNEWPLHVTVDEYFNEYITVVLYACFGAGSITD